MKSNGYTVQLRNRKEEEVDKIELRESSLIKYIYKKFKQRREENA